MSTLWGTSIAMNFIENEGLALMAVKKIRILGAVLELPAKQHCQFSPFSQIYEVNVLDWQCYLAGKGQLIL